jgi:hypothetical protein
MPTMHIYRAKRKITSKEFQDFFYILRDIEKDELFWKVDKEQSPIEGPREIQIWISGASSGADIAYLLPNWQLIIDGVKLKKGYYRGHINVGGRDVELQCSDYRFICSFPASEDRPTTEISDLQATLTGDDK